MRSSRLLGLAAGCFILVPALAAPPHAGEEKRSTVRYDVSDLLSRPGHNGIEEVARAVVTAVDPERWGAEGEGASTLHEVNGTVLEAHATAAQHAQVRDLLTALRVLADVAVDLRGRVYDFDRGAFEKEIAPKLGAAWRQPGGPLPAPVDAATAELLRRRARPLRSAQATVANNREATLFSLRRVRAYAARPAAFDAVLDGVVVRASAAVSADRRRVRLRLTQDVTELVGMEKRTAVDPAGKEVAVEVPDLARRSVSGTAEVEDGGLVLVALLHLPPGTVARDRVAVLAVEPVIRIEAERKERARNPAGKVP